MLLHRTCKEVARLIIEREDRRLPWPDRLALRLHLRICAACPRFERQVLGMRQAFGRWRHYGGGDGASDER